MTISLKHKFAITGTITIAALCVGMLPIVSNAAVNGAQKSDWAQKVGSFEAARIMPLADDLAAELTMLHTQTAGLTHDQRDAAQTHHIEKLDISLISASEYNAAEMQCLSEAVYFEARSETFSGQKAVGEVVVNRVASKHFPNTICGVIYQGSERSTGCQFSFTCDGSMDAAPKGKAWERSQTIAQHIMIGAHKPMTQNATHYHTTDINPGWASYVKPTRTIGSHKFYKFKSRRELAMTRNVAP